MNCDTGHLVRDIDKMEEACLAKYNKIPSELIHAAEYKLNGKDEAMVSLRSGGKLSGFAAMTRNQRRNARKKLGY